MIRESNVNNAKNLPVGAWVKVMWEDADDDWWLVAEKLRKNSHWKCTRMYNPLTGGEETINHDQFVEVGQMISIPK
jgi:hypothetical protein